MSELSAGYSTRVPVSETSVIESGAFILIITVRYQKQWVAVAWCKE
jgi:hypothetical protein